MHPIRKRRGAPWESRHSLACFHVKWKPAWFKDWICACTGFLPSKTYRSSTGHWLWRVRDAIKWVDLKMLANRALLMNYEACSVSGGLEQGLWILGGLRAAGFILQWVVSFHSTSQPSESQYSSYQNTAYMKVGHMIPFTCDSSLTQPHWHCLATRTV